MYTALKIFGAAELSISSAKWGQILKLVNFLLMYA